MDGRAVSPPCRGDKTRSWRRDAVRERPNPQPFPNLGRGASPSRLMGQCTLCTAAGTAVSGWEADKQISTGLGVGLSVLWKACVDRRSPHSPPPRSGLRYRKRLKPQLLPSLSLRSRRFAAIAPQSGMRRDLWRDATQPSPLARRYAAIAFGETLRSLGRGVRSVLARLAISGNS